MSVRRGDADWVASAWADPATRVLVLDNARALVRFGEKGAELVLVAPSQAPDGLNFLLGADDDGVAYFGVLGPPGCLEALEQQVTAEEAAAGEEPGEPSPSSRRWPSRPPG